MVVGNLAQRIAGLDLVRAVQGLSGCSVAACLAAYLAALVLRRRNSRVLSSGLRGSRLAGIAEITLGRGI